MGKQKAKAKTKRASFGGPDFGQFSVGHPDEAAFISELREHAARNATVPGTFHARLTANHKATGEVIATKTYHVDLNKQQVVVEEERGGKLAARATISLAGGDVEADPRPPALATGSEAAVFHREPFAAADLDIDDEFRAWSMTTMDERLPGLAAVECCLGVFRERQQDCYSPAQNLLPANVARMGATLAKMRRAPGVQRALAEGWLDVGEPNGLAFSLEWLDDENWWLATRAFRRRAGPIGEWSGPWIEQEGSGPAGLPGALRALRFPLPAAQPWETGEPTTPDHGEMEVHLGELQPHERVPTSADGYAALIGRSFEAEVAAQKVLPKPRLFVFRGRKFERYHLDGSLPTDLDDFVRNVLRGTTAPDAAVLVQVGLVPIERGALAKCLLTIAEHADVRFIRAMEVRVDAEGKVRATRHLQLDSEDSSVHWLGVEPITELSASVRVPEPEH